MKKESICEEKAVMDAKLCIKNGEVFDSKIKRFQKKDILIANGKIRSIQAEITSEKDMKIVDAENKLVVPGLIDFHMHAFRYGHLFSIDTEELSPRSGTTTFIDGGSTGSLNFLAFREYVIKPANSRIFAFLNVSAIGQATDGIQGLHVFENDDERLLHIPSALEVIEKNRDCIVGVKVRAYMGLKSMVPLQKARELADLVNLPIMVHLAPSPPNFTEILPYLKAGDVLTHIYHGGKETIIDVGGKVRPEYWEAKKRGIEIDVGLDRFHGDLTVMKQGLEQGFFPNYISTDLSMPNLHDITFDLPTTISKFVALGLPLSEALTLCTYAPAVKIGKDNELGRLEEGRTADVAIFEMGSGDFTFEDYFGNTIQAQERLFPVMTIRAGEILQPNDRMTESWDCVCKGRMKGHFGI
jgi:dihydroorotase